MSEKQPPDVAISRGIFRYLRALGPTLITACVVFGPGSLVVSAKVGATYRYELLWVLIFTGTLMAFFVSMGARIGVAGSATPCTLLARELGKPAAVITGGVLCLICTVFQFSNNMAFALVADAIVGGIPKWVTLICMNAIMIFFLLVAGDVYKTVERLMKVMVGVVLVCFLFNLLVKPPDLGAVLAGLLPHIPGAAEPEAAAGAPDPLLLIASLVGTTFSIAAAFYQGNLVREKGWTIKQYREGIGDAICGVGVLTAVSFMIMLTAATVIPGRRIANVADLAMTLRPLLGPAAYSVFCVGLVAVAMNPFLINAMIGGGVLADALGLRGGMSGRAARWFTIGVLLVGMTVALVATGTKRTPVQWIVFGQALTVVGNPLMALSMLYLANSKAVMGEYRNGPIANIAGVAGFLVVLGLAGRMIWILTR